MRHIRFSEIRETIERITLPFFLVYLLNGTFAIRKYTWPHTSLPGEFLKDMSSHSDDEYIHEVKTAGTIY